MNRMDQYWGFQLANIRGVWILSDNRRERHNRRDLH